MSQSPDIAAAAVTPAATSMDDQPFGLLWSASRLRGNDGVVVNDVVVVNDGAVQAATMSQLPDIAAAAPSTATSMDDQPLGLLWSASRLRGNDGAVVNEGVVGTAGTAGNDGALATATVDSAAFARVTATVDTTANLVAMPLPVARTSTASVAPTPVFAPPPASGASSAGAVGGGVLALLLVVGLILALAWLAKRMPGVGAAGAGNPALRVVGSLALGPRDRVVVVEVGQTQLLLGVGPGGTRTLHTLDAPLPVAATNGPSPFAQMLSQHFGKKS